MSLASAFPNLRSEIEVAFKKIRDQGSSNNANSDALISDLSKSMADSIQKYMESADVITNDTINPGQPASTAIVPFTGVGIYSSIGSGTGKGSIKFPTNAKLKSDIELAYRNSRNLGSQDDANVNSIILSLATAIANAVHNFALTAIVKTDVTVAPGVSVSGYINSVGGIPVISFSGPGNGTGIGNLS